MKNLSARWKGRTEESLLPQEGSWRLPLQGEEDEGRKTPGDVIKDVWANIAQTGELPATQSREDEFEHRRQAFSAFREFVRSAPQAPDWFVHLTDEETGDVVTEELLAKDEGGQPCADS